MGYFRKIVGERLYLSPFDASDIEIYTKWAEWLNDRAVSDNFGGHHNLVTLMSAKKTLDGDVLIGHISLHDIDHLKPHKSFYHLKGSRFVFSDGIFMIDMVRYHYV